jgi:hypothetical protein
MHWQGGWKNTRCRELDCVPAEYQLCFAVYYSAVIFTAGFVFVSAGLAAVGAYHFVVHSLLACFRLLVLATQARTTAMAANE